MKQHCQNCAFGMGLVGRGACPGWPDRDECPEFITEEDWLEEMADEVQACPRCKDHAEFDVIGARAPFPHPLDLVQCRECGELSRREDWEGGYFPFGA